MPAQRKHSEGMGYVLQDTVHLLDQRLFYGTVSNRKDTWTQEPRDGSRSGPTYIDRHNVHHGHCRIVGPSPIRGHTLERGTAKVPLNYKFWLPPVHFRLFVLRSQGIKRRDTTPSGVTDT